MKDGLSVTVTTAKSTGEFSNYFRGEIEEDTWHKAVLVKIVESEGNYKGKTYPAWSWIYELQGDEFTIEDKDGNDVQAQVTEKTSQKFTGHPRVSKAYERYSQLSGEEPEPGDEVNLKDLFGTVCKVMIKNHDSGKETDDGDPIIYHNIEKVSVKGIDKKKVKIKDEEEDDEDDNHGKGGKKGKAKKDKKDKSKKDKHSRKKNKDEDEEEEDDGLSDIFDD